MAKRKHIFSLLVFYSSTIAQAEEPLAQARRLFEDLEYRQALEVAQRLIRTPIEEPEQLVEAMVLSGMCLGILGEGKKAEELFLQVLVLKPDFRLPADTTPKVVTPFQVAGKKSVSMGRVSLGHTPPAEVDKLAGLELEVALPANPLKMVEKIRLRYRAGGKEAVQEKAVKNPGTFHFTLGPQVQGKELNYSFQALSRWGGVLQRWPAAGGEALLKVTETAPAAPPVVAQIPPPVSPWRPEAASVQAVQDSLKKEEERSQTVTAAPWWKSWWFWTIIGAAVAGATTGVVLGTKGGGTSYSYEIGFE